MKIEFLKMHGLGNDFVIIDRRASKPLKLTTLQIKKIADRKYGIGCDQVIILKSDKKYDCSMQIYNIDGSKSEACGNATRCIAKIINKKRCQIKVGKRILTTERMGEDVAVNIGHASFEWQSIPLAKKANPLALSFKHSTFKQGYAVNVGNPHVIFIVKSFKDLDLTEIGNYFNKLPLLPLGANVNFALIKNKKSVELKVFERGSGLTLACGTGACATVAALHKLGLTDKQVTVNQAGGKLLITIKTEGIIMTGPAELSFKGTIEI